MVEKKFDTLDNVCLGHYKSVDYLTDDSGNRRFLPVKTEIIDVAALRQNRDKLWADAVYFCKQGERWWLDGILLKYAQDQTKRRLESDPWMEQILLKALDRSEITIKEAFELCFPEKTSIKSRKPIVGACLHAYKKWTAGQYIGVPKHQTKFVRMTDQ